LSVKELRRHGEGLNVVSGGDLFDAL